MKTTNEKFTLINLLYAYIGGDLITEVRYNNCL